MLLNISQLYIFFKKQSLLFSGITSVKAIYISDSVFDSGGILTLGQITPGLKADVSMGVFMGYIDEVRVWSRPHNPTIITNNFRVKVTSETSDILYNWNFNEGIGFTAFESKQSENMVVINTLNPPVWVQSDLKLSENYDIEKPKLTTAPTVTPEEIKTAQQICQTLMSNFSVAVTGSSVELLTEVYDELCIKEIIDSGDTAQAEAVLAGAADLYVSAENSSSNPISSLCNVVNTLSDYIGASGQVCKQCVFGEVKEDNCICLDTHWGPACTAICPVGTQGACSVNGVCSSESGICQCYPRHYTSSVSVTSVWKGIVFSISLNISEKYTCDRCSQNWVGKDCHFSNSLHVSFIGIIYGSYVTTFDGISFTHIVPGIYTLLKTTTVNIQCLFLPCFGINKCRYIKELAIRFDKVTVKIQHNIKENVTVTLDDEELFYPHHITSAGKMEVKWTEYPFIKVTFSRSHIIVYDSEIGLIISANIESDIAKSNKGLLGSADGSWENDILCEGDTQNFEEITGNYAGECVVKRYIPKSDDAIISHHFASEPLSSGGYALSLSDELSFTVGISIVQQSLPDFTISYWMKLDVDSTQPLPSYTLLSVDVGSSTLAFKVINSHISVQWITDQTTTLRFDLEFWYYLTFTWRSKDGSAVIYLVRNGLVEKAILTFNVGLSVTIQEVTIISAAATRITVDQIRVWAKYKTENEILSDINIYSDASNIDKNLLISMLFDEGRGNTSAVTIYNTNHGTKSESVAGNISGISISIPLKFKSHAFYL